MQLLSDEWKLPMPQTLPQIIFIAFYFEKTHSVRINYVSSLYDPWSVNVA
jgi:hypothetical protein